MIPYLVIIALVGILVLIARYRETPDAHRPGFLHWLLRRKNRYPLDESAKRFAEQWGNHPTLSKRRARAIKRSLRKR